MILYNANVDIVNDNVYAKFVYILSIHSQDIEQNQILKSVKGRNSIVYLKTSWLPSKKGIQYVWWQNIENLGLQKSEHLEIRGI